MIDNSKSMNDKQEVLAQTIPDLVARLVNPSCLEPGPDGTLVPVPADKQPTTPDAPCPAGSERQVKPVRDIHLGVITSSLGGHGADLCLDVAQDAPGQSNFSKNFTMNDRGRLITRGPRPDPETVAFPPVDTYENLGFLVWDPDKKSMPPGEGDAAVLTELATALVRGADQIGCGYESSLEAWYRFLVDPRPPASIKPPAKVGDPVSVEGVDEVLLKQRADFLRPDSLVAVLVISDENDCSIIDGQLPATVCDDPELDAEGNPAGCKGAKVGWPQGYAEGNFHDRKVGADGRVTGTPFPTSYLAAQQFAIKDGFQKQYLLKSGKPACADDPYSPACSSCYLDGSGECTQLNDKQDPANLRCWDQKRRFGVDMLYPLRRYVDGLSQQKVYDRDGFLVPNPLFDDLPFKVAQKAGKPLDRPKLPPRPANRVFFVPIVGVPWQDLARDPNDPALGYKPASGPGSLDWDLILGNPFALKKEDRKGPADPLMIEAIEPRSGTHPVTGETIGGASTWNRINGHEWKSGPYDLQYVCIFDLPKPKDCQSDASCECVNPGYENPLCEVPGPDGKGSGVDSTTRYRAKAYPGTRFLQVAKDMSASSVVGSICTPNLTDTSRADFGYRPAIDALAQRIQQAGVELRSPPRTATTPAALRVG